MQQGRKKSEDDLLKRLNEIAQEAYAKAAQDMALQVQEGVSHEEARLKRQQEDDVRKMNAAKMAVETFMSNQDKIKVLCPKKEDFLAACHRFDEGKNDHGAKISQASAERYADRLYPEPAVRMSPALPDTLSRPPTAPSLAQEAVASSPLRSRSYVESNPTPFHPEGQNPAQNPEIRREPQTTEQNKAAKLQTAAKGLKASAAALLATAVLLPSPASPVLALTAFLCYVGSKYCTKESDKALSRDQATEHSQNLAATLKRSN